MTTTATISYQSDSLPPMMPRAADLAEAWLDEITNLYLLCFLLTADKVLAEQCFAEAMDDYLLSPADALGDWSRGEGRASVIRRAVQIIRPVPKRVESWSLGQGSRPLLSAVHQPFSAITSLGAFDRFVFVLSVIEGESDETCAALLDCEVAEVGRSRDLANRLIAAVETEDGIPMPDDATLITSALTHLHCGIC